jgi:hypothetical protein
MVETAQSLSCRHESIRFVKVWTRLNVFEGIRWTERARHPRVFTLHARVRLIQPLGYKVVRWGVLKFLLLIEQGLVDFGFVEQGIQS